MFRKHPRIKVESSAFDKKVIRFGWVLLLSNIGLILAYYTGLPEKIPTHFNYKGEVDGYGAKSTLWIIPIVVALIYYGLNLVIKKVPPYKHNYPVTITEKNAPIVYAMSIKMMVLLNFSIVCIFLLISLQIILLAKGAFTYNIMPVVIILTAFITLLPFYYIYKMFKVPK